MRSRRSGEIRFQEEELRLGFERRLRALRRWRRRRRRLRLRRLATEEEAEEEGLRRRKSSETQREKPGAVYASQNLQFKLPVYIEDEVLAEVQATSIRAIKEKY
ncbi:uncharacterized protein A4U43_C04F17740 [Asparagus officinalis]|uniref:Uncharacterized protein n=1 Tax=Asparagus officinalis TaxID=4686 RepID=A0A5P1F292_ASPOF|nr:uncharacterized protein A4U43_C04F17740 [Asparagus officinalis]